MYNPEDLTKNIKLKLLLNASSLVSYCDKNTKVLSSYSESTLENIIVFNYTLLHQEEVDIEDFWEAVKVQGIYSSFTEPLNVGEIATYWVDWENTGRRDAFYSLYYFAVSSRVEESLASIFNEVQKLKGLLPRSLYVQP